MIENEIIYDRIKGCLTAVALSDALNNLKLTTGKSFKSAFKFNPDYREKPVPEQYLQYYKGKNTTDKYLFCRMFSRTNDNHTDVVFRIISRETTYKRKFIRTSFL